MSLALANLTLTKRISYRKTILKKLFISLVLLLITVRRLEMQITIHNIV